MAVDKKVIDGLLDDFGVESSQVKISDDIIDQVLQKYIKIWQDNLAKKNHIGTGNLFQSLASDKGQYGFRTESKGGKIRIYLSLPEYYEYTDTGRGATEKGGTGQLRKNLMGLKGWISQKGLIGGGGMTVKQKVKLKNGTIKEYTRKLTAVQANKALAFLISRKIHKKGFKGTKWFSSDVDNFMDEIVEALNIKTGKVFELVINKVVEDTNKK